MADSVTPITLSLILAERAFPVNAVAEIGGAFAKTWGFERPSLPKYGVCNYDCGDTRIFTIALKTNQAISKNGLEGEARGELTVRRTSNYSRRQTNA